MRTAFVLIGTAIFLAASAFADPIIVKQRALELRDQNNVRQGIAPATQPGQGGQPAAPVTSSPPSQLLQQSLAKVKADLTAIQANSPVTTTQKQQLTKDLLACAQGAGKPSQATVSALADSLTAAFSQKPLSDASRNRLVSRLAAVMNPANIQPSQLQAIYADVQAIFQDNGTVRRDAVKIADQVKAIGAETQK
jgi:hypothetical protein